MVFKILKVRSPSGASRGGLDKVASLKETMLILMLCGKGLGQLSGLKSTSVSPNVKKL